MYQRTWVKTTDGWDAESRRAPSRTKSCKKNILAFRTKKKVVTPISFALSKGLEASKIRYELDEEYIYGTIAIIDAGVLVEMMSQGFCIVASWPLRIRCLACLFSL